MVLLPSQNRVLQQFGQDIKLARLRRKYSTHQVAERAGISRATLWQIEKGSPQVAMGSYFLVLFVLGLESNFMHLSNDDILGRKLQDAGILPKKRAAKQVS